MDSEIWKDIKGYEGLYQVSNFGRVKRTYKNGKVKFISLKSKNEHGYIKISLCKNKKQITARVHKIVADTFLEKRKRFFEVNHKDGNKENNRVDNLEFVSHKENIIHSFKHGLHTKESIKYRCDRMHKAREIKIKMTINNKVYFFDSIIKASKETKKSKNSIRKYLQKIVKQKDGSIWEYC